MKSPLEQLSELELVIRELYKIDSKLLAGQVILAHRENRKLIAALEKVKFDIVKAAKENKSSINAPNSLSITLPVREQAILADQEAIDHLEEDGITKGLKI